MSQRRKPSWLSSVAVDVHAHALAPQVDELTRGLVGRTAEDLRLRESIGPVSAQVNASLNRDRWQHLLTDVPSRLEAMDAAGIDVQVISVAPTQYHLWTDQVLAGDVAAAALEDVAAQCAQAPERLVGLTSVSLQHPALIGDQIQRAMTKGMRGIEVPTMVGDQDLSDRKLDPLWEAAEDQGAVVFIHPLGCQFGKRLHDHYLGNVIGQPLETTIALSKLILAGVLDRFPRLKISAAHGGGYLPFYPGRLDRAWKTRDEARTCKEPPSSYLDRIWYDTVVHSPELIGTLVNRVGTDRVMLGTDYPYDMGIDDPLGEVEATPDLDLHQREAIAGNNAQSLFRISATNLDTR